MVGCKVQIVIVVALPDQVRWLRLRAVALRGVPADPWSGEAGTFSRKPSVSIHPITPNAGAMGTPDTKNVTGPVTRGATRHPKKAEAVLGDPLSDHLSQAQTVHRAARRLKSLRAVLVFDLQALSPQVSPNRFPDPLNQQIELAFGEACLLNEGPALQWETRQLNKKIINLRMERGRLCKGQIVEVHPSDHPASKGHQCHWTTSTTGPA